MFPLSEGVWKRRTRWGMWKWIGNPLASVGDQSSPKIKPHIICQLPYARKRNLDKNLFCRGSSARLPPTSHAHKINSHPGINIYATSQRQQIFWSIIYKQILLPKIYIYDNIIIELKKNEYTIQIYSLNFIFDNKRFLLLLSVSIFQLMLLRLIRNTW